MDYLTFLAQRAGLVDELQARIYQLIRVNNEDLERRRTAERERDGIYRILMGFLASAGELGDGDQLAGMLLVKNEWSRRTFGESYSVLQGVIEHIRKELDELRADPTDPQEWIDVILLGMDGYWRSLAGRRPLTLMKDLAKKMAENIGREWVPGAPGEPIEHKRENDASKEQ